MTDIEYSLENINHRFSGGQLRAEGQVFTIKTSSHRLLYVEDGYEVEPEVEDYRLRFYVEAHGLSDPEIQPRVGQFVAMDDDDFNDDDVIMQGERDVGIKDGDEGELVPKPDLDMVDASDLNDCSANSCNVFAKAYIRPIYDLSAYNSTVPFVANPKLNFDSDRPGWRGLLDTYDFGQSETGESEKFWTVYLLGAYQADILNDCDTTEEYVEPCVSGQVDDIGGVGASIFYESWREAAKIDPNYKLTASKVTAHELGHLLGGKHKDLGLMGSTEELYDKNIFVMPSYFSDRSLVRMRSMTHP